MQLVERLRDGDVATISPKKTAADTFNATLQEKMSDTVWTSGCASWYLDKNGNVASWPWSYDKFTNDLSEPDWDDFNLTYTTSRNENSSWRAPPRSTRKQERRGIVDPAQRPELADLMVEVQKARSLAELSEAV